MNLMLAVAALLNWADFDLQQHVNLEQDLVLEQTSGGPGVTLPKGTSFTVKDVMPLDQISVEYYSLQFDQCPAELANQKSDMTIVNDVYGVELSEGCQVGVFVEFKDLYTASPFSLK